MMAKARTALEPEARKRIEDLIAAKGLGMASRLLGVAATTLHKARLGGELTDATALWLRTKIQERDASGKSP